MNLIYLLVSALSIIGVILNIYKIKEGFIVWMFTNVSWIIIDFYEGLYEQIPIFIVFTGSCIWGYRKWDNEDSTTSKTTPEKVQ